MSAPITEAHIDLVQTIWASLHSQSMTFTPCAQLIADSEAAAVQVAMLREYGNLCATNEGLAKERDQLRDELAAARQRETIAIASWDEERNRALREGERVVEWRDRAERAEALLKEWNDAADASRQPDAYYDGYSEAQMRAMQAMLTKAEAELAAERARLDWLVKSSDNPLAINLFPSYGWTEVKKNLRASIDAAMKEGAK